MKLKLLPITALALFAPLAQAGEKIFQNEKEGYEGYRQAAMRGEHDVEKTMDGTRRKMLKIVGVPQGGQKSMAVIGFEDLFDPAKGGLSPEQSITSARLELFKIGQDADPKLIDRASDWNRSIAVHLMLTPFYGKQDGEGYSCFSYRRFGGTSEDLYWGTDFKLTSGPVRGVDYEREAIDQIRIEPEANEQWYSVDVTQAVQRMREAGENIGFLLIARDYWLGLHFASGTNENAERRPRLVVEY